MIYIFLQLSLEIVIELQNILDINYIAGYTEIIYLYPPFKKRFKYMAIN